jgi:hypothetical protein
VSSASSAVTSRLPNAITSRLPNITQHAKKHDAITKEIQALQQALNDKTGVVFKQKVAQTVESVKNEKKELVRILNRMNGTYYQDSTSPLKKAWDKLVTMVKTVGSDVERLEQLTPISTQLNAATATPATEAAKKAIHNYGVIEKKRNELQAKLEKTIGIQKADGRLEVDLLLEVEQKKLEKRHQELCGDYFNGELDRAWRQAQVDPTTLTAYQTLEAERKHIEAELYEIRHERLIPAAPAGNTYQDITVARINAQLTKLNELQALPDLTSVNWKQLVITEDKNAFQAALRI